MSNNSFYSKEELQRIGFISYGRNVLISKKASIYSPELITIGDNVRIDDFCILSGKIFLGNNVHIAGYVSLFAGNAGIYCDSFVGVSSRTAIYAASDDYLGEYLTNPTIPNKYRNITSKEVVLKKHVLIGTGCTVLPGVTLNEGVSVGAMSLVNKDLEEWSINVGIPAKKVKERSRKLLELEQQYLNETRNAVE
jgi:galactoside O-acetyltransferase